MPVSLGMYPVVLASASEPPPTNCPKDWVRMGCEGYVEDRNDPDEEVQAPVSSIGAGSTALMLMLIDCKDSLVADDDA